jgi:hypothetical protein
VELKRSPVELSKRPPEATKRPPPEIIARSPPEIIARSPHLAKDFAPNGERIRDSWRARRKQRIRENHKKVEAAEVHKKPPVNP